MATTPAGDPAAASAALTVAAVARRLGVAPATLRTWDRRYGLGPSAHTAGAHRRYTPADVARLGVMRRLTLEGVAPADAAQLALHTELGPGHPGATVTALPAAPPPPADRPTGRGGGGRVVALPDGTPAARGLARAAMALDSVACAEIVRAHLERSGVLTTWEQLLVPVLVGVGERWQATGQGVEVEHVLAESVMGSLRAVTLGLRDPVNVRPVLLACAEEEQHALPLHAVAAALAERQVTSRILGPRVPRDALVSATRRAGPAAVFVWSHLPSTGDPGQLGDLPVQRPATRVVAGGPGWPRDRLPHGVLTVDGLGEAVERLLAATGA